MFREADVDGDWSKANFVEACEVFYRCGNGFDNVAELQLRDDVPGCAAHGRRRFLIIWVTFDRDRHDFISGAGLRHVKNLGEPLTSEAGSPRRQR